MSSTHDDPSVINLLRLPPADMRKILDAINRKGGAGHSGRQRRVRVPYENPNVILETDDGTGRLVKHRVQARNISTHGMSVVNGQFMHVKRPCTIQVQTLNGGATVRIAGRIERCRLVAGRIHEIGIVFATPTDISLLVKLDVASEIRVRNESEKNSTAGKNANPRAMLSGKALIVEGLEVSRKLYSAWLGMLGLTGVEASDEASAISLISGVRYDVILVDMSIGLEENGALITQLRKADVTSPIIAMSSESQPAVKTAAISAGADLFLEKPFDLEMLQHAIFNQLLCDRFSSQRHESIRSTRKGDKEIAALISDSVNTIKMIGGELQSSMAAADPEKVRSVLRTVIEAGKGYGFSDLVNVAQATVKLLKSNECHSLEVRRGVERTLNAISRCAA